MNPCFFARVLVGNLTLSLPVASRPAVCGVHPSSSPCFCVIHFNNQKFTCPVAITSNCADLIKQDLAATFHLKKPDLELLLTKKSRPKVKISIYKGSRGIKCCVSSGTLLGKVKVDMTDLVKAEEKSIVFVNGWVGIGSGRKEDGKLHLTVRSEPDPRFVFEFDGEPECSPQIVAVNDRIRQPAFSCKFHCSHRAFGTSRSLSLETSSSSKKWLNLLTSDHDRSIKERRGWYLTIHDLSGSTVAMASMQTPFVASPGTDRVSSSNPGSWIIFRRGENKVLKPWGRLEAWRERGGYNDALGYKFELMPEASNLNNSGGRVPLAESRIDMRNGGNFTIDLTGNATLGKNLSPGCSPRGSGDFGYGLYPFCYRGFVMSSRVEGEGRCSKPRVEVGRQHVGCMEDAAAFMALSAAIDLSMDACRLFRKKLRKELRLQRGESF